MPSGEAMLRRFARTRSGSFPPIPAASALVAAFDPLQTLASASIMQIARLKEGGVRSTMRTWLRLLGCSYLVATAQVGAARPASYVPDQQWTKEAWKCREAAGSFVEIERVRLATATVADLRVAGLQVDGKPIVPEKVEGLEEFLAGLGEVQAISGGCGWTGEFILIRGFVREGPDLRATREQRFFIPYRR